MRVHNRPGVNPGMATVLAIWLTGMVTALSAFTAGTVAAAEKYALLVAVSDYDHPEMNTTKLFYPTKDAREFRTLLVESGYEVDLLEGKDATQGKILEKLKLLGNRGGDQGVVLVGLFGHGIEFSRTRKSYFCPWDTPVQAVRDMQGNPLFDDKGKPKFEPVAAKLVAMDEFLIALRESKAAHRVLLADCCRNDPNVARGRSFGSSLEINQLPQNTAVLFACSEGQKAFEHSDWGHGAFTKVALEVLRSHAAQGKTTMGSIAEEIGPAVEQLTKTKLRDDEQAQTPRLLLTGTRIDLMLSSSANATRTRLPLASSLPQVPPAPQAPPQPIVQLRLAPGQVLTVRKVIGPGILSTTAEGKESVGKAIFFNEDDQVRVKEVGPESVLIASLEGGRSGWLKMDLVAQYLLAP